MFVRDSFFLSYNSRSEYERHADNLNNYYHTRNDLLVHFLPPPTPLQSTFTIDGKLRQPWRLSIISCIVQIKFYVILVSRCII